MLLKELHDVIARVDVIIINDEEAIQLSGKENLFTAAQEIKMGPSHIQLKKQNMEQCYLVKTEIYQPQHILSKTLIDPTGAGDCFAGGFAGFLAQCEDINFQNL